MRIATTALLLHLCVLSLAAETFWERYPLPNDAQIRELWQQRQYEELWQSFDRIPEEGRNPRWYHALAGFRTSLGQLPEARQLLEAGVERYPDESRLWLSLSRVYRETWAYDQALASLDRAVSLAQGDEDLLAWCSDYRARTLARTGRLLEARSLYDSLITTRPRDANFLLNSMDVEGQLGNLDSCRIRFRRADSLGVSQYGRCVGYRHLAFAAL